MFGLLYKFCFTTMLMLMVFLGLAHTLKTIAGLVKEVYMGPTSLDDQINLIGQCLFIAVIYGVVEVARVILREMKAKELRNEQSKK